MGSLAVRLHSMMATHVFGSNPVAESASANGGGLDMPVVVANVIVGVGAADAVRAVPRSVPPATSATTPAAPSRATIMLERPTLTPPPLIPWISIS